MSVEAPTEHQENSSCPLSLTGIVGKPQCCYSVAHPDGHCNGQSLMTFPVKDIPVRVNLLRIQFHLVGVSKKMFFFLFQVFILPKVVWWTEIHVLYVSELVSHECSAIFKCEFLKKDSVSIKGAVPVPACVCIRKQLWAQQSSLNFVWVMFVKDSTQPWSSLLFCWVPGTVGRAGKAKERKQWYRL